MARKQLSLGIQMQNKQYKTYQWPFNCPVSVYICSVLYDTTNGAARLTPTGEPMKVVRPAYLELVYHGPRHHVMSRAGPALAGTNLLRQWWAGLDVGSWKITGATPGRGPSSKALMSMVGPRPISWILNAAGLALALPLKNCRAGAGRDPLNYKCDGPGWGAGQGQCPSGQAFMGQANQSASAHCPLRVQRFFMRCIRKINGT